MTWLRMLAMRLRAMFAKPEMDRALDEELQSHFDMLVEQNIGRGMPREEARRAARLELGGANQIKESVHDQRGRRCLNRFGRMFATGRACCANHPASPPLRCSRSPSASVPTPPFLASSTRALKNLCVASPHELVLFSDSPAGGSASGTHTGRWSLFSNENYSYFRAHGASFTELCAFESGWNDLQIRVAGAAGRPDGAHGRLVTGNFFSFLGLSASAGRLFTPDDDRLGAPPTVVLNYPYWVRKFHADPSMLGKVLEINGVAFTVIGVGPRTFLDVKFDRPDLWLPLVFQPQVMSDKIYSEDPQEYWLNIIARLKRGATLRQAQTEVNGQLKQILLTQAHRETAQEIADSYIQLARAPMAFRTCARHIRKHLSARGNCCHRSSDRLRQRR